MAYIALPNIAWQRLLETGLDATCGPTHADLHPTNVNLRPARADSRPCLRANLWPACTKNQPEITSGTFF